MVIYAVRILEVDHLPGLSVHEAVYTKPGIRHEMPWKPERLSVNAPGKEPTYIGGIDIYHRTQTSTLEPPGNERAPGTSFFHVFVIQLPLTFLIPGKYRILQPLIYLIEARGWDIGLQDVYCIDELLLLSKYLLVLLIDILSF